MKDIPYDSSRPLMQLEPGDKAVIKVGRFPFANENDKQKYGAVPVGIYEAECTGPYILKCIQQPLLSGTYNYWHGDKWGCSENIYADEKRTVTEKDDVI